MSLLNDIYSGENYKIISKELADIKSDLHLFENYCFLIYEKFSIYVEIKNKYFDIKKRYNGYLNDIEKSSKFNSEKKLNFYFKGWTNRKLKRIIKILKLEIRKDEELISKDTDIAQIVLKLNDKLKLKSEMSFFEELSKKLQYISINLKNQLKYFNSIYPLLEWNFEIHDKLFNDRNTYLDSLLKEELKTFFGFKSLNENYNDFPALISESIHHHNIPEETYLGKLVKDKIRILKSCRKQEKLSEFITVFHARAFYEQSPLFPLDTKYKNAGFFVDLNLNETRTIVREISGHSENEIVVFKIEMPLNLFKLFIPDNHSTQALKDVSLDNSYVLRPSDFPKFNEFYKKGLVKTQRM